MLDPALLLGSLLVCAYECRYFLFLSLRNARRRRRTKCLKGGPTRRIGSAELISSGAWKAKVAYGLTYSFFASSSLPLMCPCFIGTCFLFFFFRSRVFACFQDSSRFTVFVSLLGWKIASERGRAGGRRKKNEPLMQAGFSVGFCRLCDPAV